LLKQRAWQASLSFHHSAEHAPSRLYSIESGQDGKQGSNLARRPLCSILLTAARVLYVSLTTEKDEERGCFPVWIEFSIVGFIISDRLTDKNRQKWRKFWKYKLGFGLPLDCPLYGRFFVAITNLNLNPTSRKRNFVVYFYNYPKDDPQ
jgi:hypothetical protein